MYAVDEFRIKTTNDMDINKILERIHDVYESHDGGGIWLSEQETVKLINILAEIENSSNDIHDVSVSLPFAEGFVEGEGYCDAGCKAVVWENDLCMYRKECPIGCGTAWVLPGNDR